MLIAGGAIFIVFGIVSRVNAPESVTRRRAHRCIKPNAKVNQDIAEIGKFIPTDEGWIVLSTPDYPDPQSGIGLPCCE